MGCSGKRQKNNYNHYCIEKHLHESDCCEVGMKKHGWFAENQ